LKKRSEKNSRPKETEAMKKQTLDQAVLLARSGKSKDLQRAAMYLSGCPTGGDPATVEAWQQMRDELPRPNEREYSEGEFVAAVYTIDNARRYRSAL
jgi:hypothetical protein